MLITKYEQKRSTRKWWTFLATFFDSKISKNLQNSSLRATLFLNPIVNQPPGRLFAEFADFLEIFESQKSPQMFATFLATVFAHSWWLTHANRLLKSYPIGFLKSCFIFEIFLFWWRPGGPKNVLTSIDFYCYNRVFRPKSWILLRFWWIFSWKIPKRLLKHRPYLSLMLL